MGMFWFLQDNNRYDKQGIVADLKRQKAINANNNLIAA